MLVDVLLCCFVFCWKFLFVFTILAIPIEQFMHSTNEAASQIIQI